MNQLDQDAIAIFYFPLHGLRVEEEPVSIAGALLLEPTFEDWRAIEKTDVADQMLGAAMAERFGLAMAGERPPLCLATHLDWTENRRDVHPMTFLSEVEPVVTDALLGLRLLKDDVFLDFEYAGRYVTAPGGLSSRAPGPYRQTRIDVPDNLRYTLLREEVPEIEQLALLSRAYRETGVDNAGAIAVESLRHAHSVHVGDVDRLAFLYVALEALFGSYNERERFGRVPLADRAADDDLRDYLAADGRRLRNAVAHGDPPDRPLDDDVARLFAIVRAGLVHYMWFCVRLREVGAEVSALVGDEAPTSRMRLFNELLARWCEGDERAGTFLAPPES